MSTPSPRARPCPTHAEANDESSCRRSGEYRSIRISSHAKQRLDILAAIYQIPLSRMVEEVTEAWWASVVSEDGGILPERVLGRPLQEVDAE